MENNLRLDTWDYVVFITMVTATACVGIYHAVKARRSKKTTSARDFLVTNTDIGMCPLILSSVATYLSAVGMLGFPMETYKYGIQCFAFALPFYLQIIPSCYLFLPVLYNLGICSIFEYLEMRFNRFLRIWSSSMYMFEVIMYTTCVIYAPSLALNQVTGLHLWGSVIAVGAVCILYTAMGGIKSVVWADAAQVSVMFGVLLFIIGKGCMNVGGIYEVWERAQKGQRTTFAYFTSDPISPYTFWSFIIGGTIGNITETVSNQMQVQRYLCSPSLKSARRIVIGGAIGTSCIISLTSLCGIIVYANYADCDPLLSGLVTSRNQIIPLFGVKTLSIASGLPGLFVASIFCATLSTLSSSLNSLASITLEDYIKPYKPHLTDAKMMLLSKLVAIFYGILCIALVVVAESMGSLIQAVFMIFGAIGGPIFSLFYLGMMFPWVTSLGASVGFFAGISVGLWACIGTMITQPYVPSPPLTTNNCTTEFVSNVTMSIFSSAFNSSSTQNDVSFEPQNTKSQFFLYTMPYLWYSAITIATSVVFAIATTIITGANKPKEIDEALICPIVKQICVRLPLRIRRILGYEIDGVSIELNHMDKIADKNANEKDAMLPNSGTGKQCDVIH